MSSKVRIAVACPIPGERAAFMEWLSEAGYEPIPMRRALKINPASLLRTT